MQAESMGERGKRWVSSLESGPRSQSLRMAVKEQVGLTGDGFCRSASRIQVQMGVALGRCYLGLAEEAGQHRQAKAESHRGAAQAVEVPRRVSPRYDPGADRLCGGRLQQAK